MAFPYSDGERAYQNDFAARMDWCTSSFDSANHNPVAVLDDDAGNDFIFLNAKSTEIISLDASSSYDPDGDDLLFIWYVYPEASTYKKKFLFKIKIIKSINHFAKRC